MAIEKVTLKDLAHDYIRNAIVSKELDMNKIYSVPELSGLLNISRTPVREAMLQLEMEGFVEILPNKGMRIKAFDRQTITEICQMRMVVEGFCCAYLAKRVLEPEAQKVMTFLSMLMEENELNTVNFTSNDMLFHQKIVGFTGNKRFQELNSNMGLYVSLFAQKLMRWQDAANEHRKIYEAILAGDAEAAKKASDEHVLNTYSAIINSGKIDLNKKDTEDTDWDVAKLT